MMITSNFIFKQHNEQSSLFNRISIAGKHFVLTQSISNSYFASVSGRNTLASIAKFSLFCHPNRSSKLCSVISVTRPWKIREEKVKVLRIPRMLYHLIFRSRKSHEVKELLRPANNFTLRPFRLRCHFLLWKTIFYSLGCLLASCLWKYETSFNYSVHDVTNFQATKLWTAC